MIKRYKLPFADHLTLVRSGRLGTFGGNYAPLHGTRWDCDSGFNGNHRFAFGMVLWKQAGAVYPGSPAGTYQLVADPLANGRWLSNLGRYALRGWQWWPVSLVEACAGKLGTSTGQLGQGYIEADYTTVQSGYTPTYVTQIDGTTCQWFQCSPAAHAMAGDADHRGVNPLKTSAPWKPTARFIYGKIRTTCGGTSMDQNDAVLATYYGS